ncbi:U3 small nucleolar ribonucleoprotein protein MPP10 [Scyliorhinus canicula]|uniref:U3 small nucleolar ribonucleoprotein protein MPP10 n=1 Tax=Scyliorhinus canicula TaxID=7830 RepID=UPI0018F7042C|nr:U3 small nucleolar ribonucleoprotein protein MPP10 [Scyliorhinus canicula]
MAALAESARRLERAVQKPELLLSVQDGLALDFTVLTKELYDLQKAQESDTTAGSPLKELVIEQFDEEQIWQEIELQNHSVLNYFKDTVAFLLQSPFSRLINTGDVEIEAPEEDIENNESAETDGEIVEGSDGEEEELKKQAIKRKPIQRENASDELSDEDSDLNFDIDEVEERTKLQRKCSRFASNSELDDKFFRLSEMEDFLEKVEKEEEKQKDNDEIDYFEDIPSEDEELGDYFEDVPSEDDEVVLKTKTKIKTKSSRNLQYKDFFDPVDGEKPAVEGGDEENGSVEAEGEPEPEFEEEEEINEDQEEVAESKNGQEAKGVHKKVTFDLSDDSDGDESAVSTGAKKPDETKSAFEKRQEKLNAQIQQLEKSALEQKPWQLLGEVTAQKRPENSLLEEDLLFDHAVRKAPVITEETTLQLEDIILQRIKDQAWDDVVRKEKPKEEIFEYKKRLTLDHEKSKLSLAEVYEQQYLKQTEQKSEVEESVQHAEIQKFMDSLFLKLDALSNFQFTPKPPVPEVKVVSNLPSISMEEVAPVNISDATLLAPEEVKEKSRAGDVQGDLEKTETDKKRERRRKKKVKRLRLRAKAAHQKVLEKLNVKLSTDQVKEKNAEKVKQLTQEGKALLLKDEGKDKTLRSSKAFFSQLQDQVKAELKGAKIGAKKQNKHRELSASKLKL